MRDQKTPALDDWILSLPSFDRKMLAVLVTHTLQIRSKMKRTAAALEAAWITGFNEKTVCYICKEFKENRGKFRDERRGKYKRMCIFNNEELRLQASMWVREHAVDKSGPNMTAHSFCQWVNDVLLPSSD